MDLKEIENRMKNSIENMKDKFTNVRAGRANASMLDGINAVYYGTPTPLASLANITIPEARKIFIKPFDKGALKDIEKAINDANLGINPTNNGELIILTIPELTEDRRKDYVKQVKAIAEEGKVALRNIRQDANNMVKKEEHPEDIEKSLLEDVQELINKYNKIVEELLKEKEGELMTV